MAGIDAMSKAQARNSMPEHDCNATRAKTIARPRLVCSDRGNPERRTTSRIIADILAEMLARSAPLSNRQLARDLNVDEHRVRDILDGRKPLWAGDLLRIPLSACNELCDRIKAERLRLLAEDHASLEIHALDPEEQE